MNYTSKNTTASQNINRLTAIGLPIRNIFTSLISFFLLSFFTLSTLKSNAQIVINELGIGARCPNILDCDDAGGGGEFIELFNKSGCSQDISCYVLVYSGTTYTSAGWTVAIPSGTILASGQYYLIGGHSSNLLASTSWTSVAPGTLITWQNNYGTNGKDIADLDIGKAYTSGKAIIIGNLINNAGQITLFKSNGSIVSSVSYNNGNNSGSYPVTPNNSSGCSLSPIPNPNTTINRNATFNSYLIGLYLDASGNYLETYNDPNPANGPTPGKANSTNGLGTQTATAALPLANAGASTSICIGNSTTLGIAVSGNTYLWSSVPPGFTSTSSSATVSPTASTTYTLKETDAYGCSVLNSAIVTVNQKPAATAGTSKIITSGTSTSIGGAAVTGSTYSWTSSPSGFASISANPSVSPTTTTTYTLTETNANNCVASNSVIITVTAAPTTTSVTSSNSPACQGSSITFTATINQSAATGTVEFFDGLTSIGTSSVSGGVATLPPVSTLTQAGSPHSITAVYLGDANYSGSTSTAISQIINGAASIQTQPQPQVACVGGSATFTVIANGGNLTYQWQKSGSNISNGGNISGATTASLIINPVSLADASSYDVIVTSNNCGPITSAAATLTVNPIPSTPGVNIINNCNGTYTLTATGFTGTLLWNTGATTNTITVASSGVYTVTQTVNGCTSSPGSGTVTVTSPVSITTQPSNQIDCKGNAVIFSAAYSPVGNVTYQWQLSTDNGSTWGNIGVFPNITGASGNSSNSPIQLTIGNVGVGGSNGANLSGTKYKVIITDANGCSVTSNGTASLTVNSITAISGNVTTTICEGQSVSYTVTTSPTSTSPPITYQWIKHQSNGSWVDVPVATSATLSLTNTSLADAGEYTVRAIFPASSSTGVCTETNYNITRTLIVNANGTITLSSGTASPTLCINTTLTNIVYAIGSAATGASLTGTMPTGVTGSYNNGVFTISGTPTASGTFNYTVTTTGSSCINPALSGSITVNANGTIALFSGTASPTLCINTALTNIVYAIGGAATGASLIGTLPAGVTGSYNNGVFTISGTPTSSGTFNYTVTTTGSSCINPSLNGIITVNTPPVITSINPSDTSACQKNDISFISTATGSAPLTVQWEISNNGTSWSNISGATNTTYTLVSAKPADDNTWYRAVYTNACGTAITNATHLTVKAPINPGANPQSVTGCNGVDSVTFIATGNGGNGLVIMSWQFSSNGGSTWSDISGTTTTSNQGNFSTTYTFQPTQAQAGYQYRAKFSNGGCEASYSLVPATLNVDNIPLAPAVSTPVNFCQNQTAVPLTATAASNNILVWYTVPTGGTGTTTAPTPSTTAIGSTDYYVSQKTSAGGCEGPRVKVTVIVNPLPLAPTVTTPVSYCQNATASALSATATSGNTLLWYTVASAGTGSATPITPSTATVGPTTYYVSQVTTATGCEGPRAPITVTINPLPTATISGTPTTVCQNGTSPAITFAGANGQAPYTFTYNINGAPNQTTTGPLTVPTGTPGQFIYNLVSVSDNRNCSQPQTGSVTVNVTALTNVTITGNNEFCAGSSGTILTANPTGTAYQWSFNGSNISSGQGGQSNPYTATQAGNYTVTVIINGCSNTSPPFAVAINPLPTAPTVTDGSLCGPGVVNLSSAGCSGGTLNWYTAATGGTLVNTGLTYSPNLSTTTSYWVSCTDAKGCVGPRAQVTATINAVPGLPTGVPNSRCGTGTVALSATGCTGTYKWYDVASGGTALVSSQNFTTPSITTITSYWVSCTNAAGCEGSRTEVIATVNTIPGLPTAVPNSRCGTGTVALSATGCTGTYKWYSASSGGAALVSTQNFTTPSITTTTSYWVSCTNAAGCEGPRTEVIATVNAIPTAPAPVDGTSCGPGTVTLDATGCTGTLQWYAAASGGSPIATGSPFITPSISSTTTYYVSCLSAAGCEGARTAVIATINPLTPGTIATDQTICSGGNPNAFTSVPASSTDNNVNGNITYKWYSGPSSTGPWTVIAGATAAVYDVPAGLTTTTYYYREARGEKTNGPVSGRYICFVNSNVISVTVNPLPTITGTLTVCAGLTTQLTGSPTAAASNSWASSNTSVATVSATGLVTGVAQGTATITYTDSNGCSQTVTVTVNPKPTPIITHN